MYFFLHLCSPVPMQPSTHVPTPLQPNTEESEADALCAEDYWPCFYDWLLFTGTAQAEQLYVLDGCSSVLHCIMLCEYWCYCKCFFCSCYPAASYLQFKKTDVAMGPKVLWQDVLFRVVLQLQGYSALFYSWRLIRAQVDQALRLFLIINALLWDVEIKPWLFPCVFSSGALKVRVSLSWM